MKSLGLAAVIVLAFFAGMILVKPDTCGAECTNMIKTVDAIEFKKQAAEKDAVIIDVRTPEEYASGHIEGAVNSDIYKSAEFDNYLETLDKSKKYMVYCRTGNRSGQALKLMEEKGFTNVINLSGGIVAWQAENFNLAK